MCAALLLNRLHFKARIQSWLYLQVNVVISDCSRHRTKRVSNRCASIEIKSNKQKSVIWHTFNAAGFHSGKMIVIEMRCHLANC